MLTPFDFKHVFSQSVRVSCPYITFVTRENSLNHARLGFAIAKKQVKHAHERNRLKRVIREYFRLKQHELPAIDVIVMVRSAVTELDNTAIRVILDKLWQRLLLIKTSKQ